MSDRLASGSTGRCKLNGPPCSGGCAGSFPLAFADRPADGLSSCLCGVVVLDGVVFLEGVFFLDGVVFLDGVFFLDGVVLLDTVILSGDVPFSGSVDHRGGECGPGVTRCLDGERGSGVLCSLGVCCPGIISEELTKRSSPRPSV